jgi:hypothetical protein
VFQLLEWNVYIDNRGLLTFVGFECLGERGTDFSTDILLATREKWARETQRVNSGVKADQWGGARSY